MNKELKFLIDLVLKAEKISQKPFVAKKKEGSYKNDLVTNLDLEIEKFFIKEIKANYPDFDIVSEETNSKKCISDNCFIFDPIDGTINFANGLPDWVIQICCIKNGKTVASVIYAPKFKEMYYADEKTAYLNGQQINVKQVPMTNTLWTIEGVEVFDSISKIGEKFLGIRKFGCSGMGLAYLASGFIHGFAYIGNNLWDYMPGFHICKLAGAEILNEGNLHIACMNKEFLIAFQNILKS